MKDNEKQQQNDSLRHTIGFIRTFRLGVCKKNQRKTSKKAQQFQRFRFLTSVSSAKICLKINRAQTKVNHFLARLKLFENRITLDAGING